ncbi:MAG: HelD family protein [Acidimicrobiales bacterium]
MAHPDLAAEQAYLDRAYERLEVVRAEAMARLKEAFAERGGTFQSYTERDIKVRSGLSRLDQLQLGREALVFGRIDRAGAESFHIGRLAVSDADHEPLVVDWRAPVAEPFYRATGAHPMGLRRRRHFLAEGHRVRDLEDELFSPDNPDGTAGALGLSGPSVLRAALERAHTGRMRDIVATVQAEQDEVIRAPLPGALVVQGGPGTGKTAVALHRAAYLLYTHRFPLEVQGVLVVGPNPTFLRYIDQVLPSLGETGVELSTASGLYKGARPTATEALATAHLKGGPRMAQFLRRAVRQRQRPLRQGAEIPYGRAVLTLSPEASEEIVRAARRRPGPHNARRRVVEALLWEHLAAELARRSGPGAGGERSGSGSGAATGTGPGALGPVSAAELGAQLRHRRDVHEVLERMWPKLAPEELLHDLLGARPLIELAGRGVLAPAEMASLYRERSATGAEAAWTPSDIALLDEASWLLGPTNRGRRDGGRSGGGRGRRLGDNAREAEALGGQRTFGHIVVDEAQDLTPMELRMVGRRSLSGSMTLVGDIAQATGPWAPGSWQDVMAYVPGGRAWRQVSLTVSYRAPAEVMHLAAPVLAAALPGAVPPEPVRHTGYSPRFIAASPVAPAAAEAVRQELAAVASTGGSEDEGRDGDEEGGEDGSVGVLVPGPLLGDLRAALRQAGIPFGEVGSGALDTRVSLLALADAKGLEFDAVVVVEPAQIVSTGGGRPGRDRPGDAGGTRRGARWDGHRDPGLNGLRALYVALTRCTRRLVIVHSEPLPAPLTSGLSDSVVPPPHTA